MTITAAHKNFIQTIVEDFVIDADRVEALCAGEPFQNDTEKHFQKMLFHPCQFFCRLEETEAKLEFPLTIGEVQECILDIILGAAGSEKKPALLEKVKTKLATLVDAPQFDAPFVTDVSNLNQESVTPIVLPAGPPRLFTLELRANNELLVFEGIVRGNIGEHKIEETFHLAEFDNEDFETEAEREEAKAEYADEAELRAEGIVSTEVFKYLIAKGRMIKSDADAASPSVRKLVTYAYFFDLLDRKLLYFSQIRHVTELEVLRLTSPVTIEFIQHGLSVAIARRIPRDLIGHPFYESRIKANPFEIMDYVDLTDDQVKTLTHTRILQLLSSDPQLFNVAYAKTITVPLRRLIDNITYFEAIKAKRLRLTDFEGITEIQMQNLTTLSVSYLVTNHLMLPQTAMYELEHFTDLDRAFLDNEICFKLLREDKISLFTVFRLSPGQKQFLLSPVAIKLMEDNLILFHTLVLVIHPFLERFQSQPILLILFIFNAIKLGDLEYISTRECLAQIPVDGIPFKLLKKPANQLAIEKFIEKILMYAKRNVLFEENILPLYLNWVEAVEAVLPEEPINLNQQLKKLINDNIKWRMRAIFREDPLIVVEEPFNCRPTPEGQLVTVCHSRKDNWDNIVILLHDYGTAEAWAEFFGLRLLNIFCGFPAKIHGVVDTADSIILDIRARAHRLSEEEEIHFKNKVVKVLTRGICQEIVKRAKWDSRSEMKKLSEYCNDQMVEASLYERAHKPSLAAWPIAFENIMGMAQNCSYDRPALTFFEPQYFANDCYDRMLELGGKLEIVPNYQLPRSDIRWV